MQSDAKDAANGTIVFVLGAGCSVESGAPIMANFMQRARELSGRSDCPFKKDYEALLTFRRSCLRLSYILERWWENIEDLYTQAHLQQLAGCRGAVALQKSMANVIWDVYRQLARNLDGYRALSTYLGACALQWRQFDKPRPIVVTTNYDTYAEGALCHNERLDFGRGERPPLDFQLRIAYPGLGASGRAKDLDTILSAKQIPDDALEAACAIEFIKLHGSVGWFKKDRETVIQGMEAGTYEGILRYGMFKYQEDDFVSMVSSGSLTPAIVPPLLGKAQQDQAIEANWNRAIHAFSCAREIAIIGYSFPETDTFMTRLLAEGLRQNDKLEQIFIVNPENNEGWWEKVESMFARSWWKQCVGRSRLRFGKVAHSLVQGHPDIFLREAYKIRDKSTDLSAALQRASS